MLNINKRALLTFVIILIWGSVCDSPGKQVPLASPVSGNDIVLVGNYDSLLFNQVGTQADPVIIDGTNAIARCVKVTGKFIKVLGLKAIDCNGFDPKHVGSNTFGFIVENADSIVLDGVTALHSAANFLNADKSGCTYPTSTTSGWSSGIKVKLSSNVTVRNSYMYENCGEGIAVTRSFNVLLENNTAYDNFSFNFYIDNSYNVMVTGNLSHCTGGRFTRNGNTANAYGTGEETYSGWGNQRRDISFINNKAIGCRRGLYSDDSYSSTGKETNLIVDGNEFYSTGTSISLEGENLNVSITNNYHNNPIYIRVSSGVFLSGNVRVSGTLTPTKSPIVSGASSTPTRTPTVISTTLTPTKTPTATLTRTVTPTPSRTFTPTMTRTPTPTATRTVTITPTITQTPANNIPLCVHVVWDRLLNVRHAPSMFNAPYAVNISQGAIVPVEAVFHNAEGKWAQVNQWMYFAMWLRSNNITYAVQVDC